MDDEIGCASALDGNEQSRVGGQIIAGRCSYGCYNISLEHPANPTLVNWIAIEAVNVPAQKAVGIAMLLRYMPTAKYFQYLLVGFFLSAFLNVPIIGAAIVGVALAIAFYQRAERDTELAAHASADAFIGEDE